MVMHLKDTFHAWSLVAKLGIDEVCDLIVTGRKASEVRPDEWIYPFIGTPDDSRRVLDFGCGFGRNAFGLATHGKNWKIVGYDNEAMLGRVSEFATIHYGGEIPFNLSFVSDWEQLKAQKFDCIMCSLVLQHIYEDALAIYVNDFKQMTGRLIVTGRRFNDDKSRRSTWAILEDSGLIPTEFYAGHLKIPYIAEGDPNDHNTAVYSL